ncbi:hypothetical protein AALP_AA4G159600 [Arabis alpina]|uniref:RBR-type E3 ubiquitin transferase n=1 Tax=Arabis alpina TaxID=50452 RepID=A0A087H3K8_ARAAL|nr:hypothetical protein AALP_AA4G159600 [Arabis alpina]
MRQNVVRLPAASAVTSADKRTLTRRCVWPQAAAACGNQTNNNRSVWPHDAAASCSRSPMRQANEQALIITSHSSKVNDVVLKEDNVRKHHKDDVRRVSTILSVTEVEASVLLLHYHWNVSKVDDEWFADEERVRTTVGILKKHVVASDQREVTCRICLDSFTFKDMVSVFCGHLYCSDCWNGYISTSINDGPGCLMLKCPESSYSAAVGLDMVEKLVSEEEKKKKFDNYFMRSYVEGNKKMKWCPARGCEHAVEFAGGTRSYDVSCLCSHNFCWNCIEDAHRPMDCDRVAKWIQKNGDEAENKKWLLAYTKPRPKCKREIEKTQDCMHMTCGPPCGHKFCWLCLTAWDSNTLPGDYHGCNRKLELKLVLP